MLSDACEMRKYEVSKKGITKDFSEIDVFLMKKVKMEIFPKKEIGRASCRERV